MSFAVYEHPLNERVRLLMRLELLFSQLEMHLDVAQEQNIHPFYLTLFSCIEVLERNDIRPTLSFYLDLLEKNMLRWSAHPEIHDESLQNKLREAVKLQTQIAAMNKACQQLKDDKFLASLRQRFGIAGGACDFDIPQFHYWRNKPGEMRNQDVDEWFEVIKPLKQALDFSLLFIRESNQFQAMEAENGFYQSSCEDNVSLLRIKYELSAGYFPTVSGSKHRYSISFMKPDKSSVKTQVNDTIKFFLATC